MKKLLLLTTLLLSGFFANLSSHAGAASVNDFAINNFSADYVLTNEEAGGKLTTTEEVDLKYTANNHGILRAIPIDYKGWNTKIKIKSVQRDGANEPYSTYNENGNLVLKIGDPDKTITGNHFYKIIYEQRHVVNFEGDTPEFYWDVNGTEWQQPFGSINATVEIPSNATTDKEPKCFTGTFGSTDKNCVYESKDNQINFATLKPMGVGGNMSIAVDLKPGVFKKPGPADFLKDNIANILAASVGLIASIGIFILWLKKGKDHSGRGVIIPEYKPPKTITPGEFGLLADYKVDSRDITATLIDLAIRGYVRIHEEKKKIIFISNRKYKLELLKSNYDNLKTHEKKLLDALFSTKQASEIIEVKKINKVTMSKAVQEIRESLQKDLTDKYGYFEKDAKKLGTIMTVLGGILFVASFFLLFLPGLFFAALITAISLVQFGRLMPRRSHAGVEVYEKIQGLKMYMNTAEKDRLKMMQSVDRPYAEPAKTVELFEKLLPFAIAVGVEKSWAKQFEGILNEAPDWYSGTNYRTFNSAVFASSLSGVNSSFGSSYTSSSSSGGGGFSGGGGGGGGGGGW
ncbi:DUF2207 domain-containing protein [Candidatus Saccharibacteria bacterium]|nr:DUF2207 domain-containing protein [Candidatus Saccharibacteria bacterium]